MHSTGTTRRLCPRPPETPGTGASVAATPQNPAQTLGRGVLQAHGGTLLQSCPALPLLQLFCSREYNARNLQGGKPLPSCSLLFFHNNEGVFQSASCVAELNLRPVLYVV